MPMTPTGWVPDEVLNGVQADPYQAERDAQAVQLGLPTGLSASDYLIAFQQLMSSPEWAALQQSRQDANAAQSAATWDQYQEGKDDRFNKFLTAAALGLGGAGLVAALGPGVAGAGAAGGASGGGLTGVTLPSTVAPTGAITGALGPSVPAAAGAAAVGPALAGSTAAGGAAAGGALSGLNWSTLVPSIVSGVTGVLGANAQADASGDALALSERMFNQTRADALPRIETGNRAVGVLDDVQGLTTGTPNMDRFFKSPDYAFNLAEGTKAGERALSAMGLRQSGPAVKEATRFASGLASREYGSFVDRLLATAGLGTTGAAQSAAAGANNAAIGGNALQNQGAARSSGYGAINDSVQGGISNYLLQQYLRRNPVGA